MDLYMQVSTYSTDCLQTTELAACCLPSVLATKGVGITISRISELDTTAAKSPVALSDSGSLTPGRNVVFSCSGPLTDATTYNHHVNHHTLVVTCMQQHNKAPTRASKPI